MKEKLKEKKPTMIEALSQTLQAMHKAGCLNLADIVEGKFMELYFLPSPHRVIIVCCTNLLL